MDWIHRFQLFLFDFDGLLVSTEHIHYQAYMNMLAKHGCNARWGFSKFCSLAHLNADALREAIYLEFPKLDPNWALLYEEKKEIYTDLIASGKIELMPGAEALLFALEKAGISRCVVTNSPLGQIQLIRSSNAALQTIPHFITRENYEKPKPDPECYLLAIRLHGKKGDRIIGFEDSARGFEALKKTPALPVLVCQETHPLLDLSSGAYHFESLEDISLP